MRITLAVAGFTAAQLEVTLEDNQLNIVGKRDGAEGERAYLHRGIAARGFVRSFILADGMEVEGGEAGARPAAHRSLPARAREEGEADPDPHGGLNPPPCGALV